MTRPSIGPGSGHQSIWAYRCYLIHRTREGYKAKNLLPALIPEAPISFIWVGIDDKEGLREYIDAILRSHRSKVAEFEDKKFVVSIEHAPIRRPEDPTIKVNAKRLIDVLLLRDHFDVPLWGKLSFITDGTRLVPTQYIAALAQLMPEYSKLFDPNRTWKYATEKRVREMGLVPEQVTSGMYREEIAEIDRQREQGMQRVAMANGSPSAAPQETRVSLKNYDGYFDLITRVVPADGAPYFTRRIAKTTGVLLWCGTSYQLEGPWTVYQRNASELLALGIEL